MRRLLVTGAAGFIGSNFLHFWHRQHPGDALLALDALTYAGNKHNLTSLLADNHCQFVQGSVCDQDLVLELLRRYRINTLVHFAAESHVDRSINAPDAFIETNIVGTHSLLKAARQYWLNETNAAPHRFHHVSTDEVYGSLTAGEAAFDELSRYAPNSPYAASKAAADHLVRAWHRTYGLQVTTSNCSNNYGPYHFPEKLIPLCLLNILRGKPLPIYGDGKQIRDWLHVDDHCRGIELIIQRGKPGQTYNIGADNERTNIDVVHLLCAIVDQRFAADPLLAERFPNAPCTSGERADSLITFVADRPGHDTRYAIDASRIVDELGYQARMDFATGLQHTVDWYLTHQSWWQSILDGSYRQA